MKTKLLALLFSLFVLFNISNAQNKHEGYIDFSLGRTQTHDINVSIRGIYSHPYNEYFSLGVGAGLMGTHRTLTDSEIYSYISHLIGDVYKDYSMEIPLFVNFRGRIPIGQMNIAPYYSFSFGYMLSLKPAEEDFAIREFHGISDFDGHAVLRVDEFSKGLFFAPELGISFGKTYIGVEYMFGLNNYHEVTTEYYYNNNYSSDNFYSEDTTINVFSIKFIGHL